MQSKISFDFARAKTLVDSIGAEKIKFSVALNAYEHEITGMHEWWEEEALDAFLDRYKPIVSKVDACLAMMDDIKNYVTKVSNAKDDIEKKGKNRFK